MLFLALPLCQNVPKSGFQTEFSMSKILWWIHQWGVRLRVFIFCLNDLFGNCNFQTTLFTKIKADCWWGGKASKDAYSIDGKAKSQ